MKKPTFKEWIAKQARRDDIVGDLARDIAIDNPIDIKNTKPAWELHLVCMNAIPECIVAFERAWTEYRRFISKIK